MKYNVEMSSIKKMKTIGRPVKRKKYKLVLRSDLKDLAEPN